jgi:FG-GAP-like repeat/Beta-galactosidase
MAACVFRINYNVHAPRFLSAFALFLGIHAIVCPIANGRIVRKPSDFDGDGHPDFVLYNASTHQTAVWYLNNTKLKSGSVGPTLPPYWQIAGVGDFNGDGHPDFALFNAVTGQTAIWYLSGSSVVGRAYGPSLPHGWQLVNVGDFNADSKADYVLFNPGTSQSAIWYLNGNTCIGRVFAPALPPRWRIAGVADFNGDGQLDYLLFNPSTRQSAIWYLSGVKYSGSAYGPTLPGDYALAGAADFNGDAKPDYVLYNPSTRQTAIWYLNRNVLIGRGGGPTLPTSWSLSPSGAANVPRGVFSLGTAGRPSSSTALSNPAVAGVSLRLHWSDLEPSEGVYNWSFFDVEIERAQAAGKKVLLRVGTGGDNMPSWVMTAVRSAGGRTFTFTDNAGAHTIPVFWDPTFLAKKSAMIAALGARYSANPTVQAVAASFANATSDDWAVPHNNVPDPGYSTSEVTRWRLAGYTSANLINAGNFVIDATLRAFPNQLAVLAINSNGAALDVPNDANYVARSVITSVRGRWGDERLVVSKNSISAVTTPPPPLLPTSLGLWYSSRPAIGGQALWFSFGDLTYRNNGGIPWAPATSLLRMVVISHSYGASYIELYETDVVNLPLVIQYAHTLIW